LLVAFLLEALFSPQNMNAIRTYFNWNIHLLRVADSVAAPRSVATLTTHR